MLELVGFAAFCTMRVEFKGNEFDLMVGVEETTVRLGLDLWEE